MVALRGLLARARARVFVFYIPPVLARTIGDRLRASVAFFCADPDMSGGYQSAGATYGGRKAVRRKTKYPVADSSHT